MGTFLVVNAEVVDEGKLAEYGKAVGPTLAGHEIKIHVASNDAEVIEGSAAGNRVVIMEFPDRAALDAWYHSPEYQAVIGLRLAATNGFGLVVEGR